MTASIRTLFLNLEGFWTLKRTMTNGNQIQGVATFIFSKEDKTSLLFEERGKMIDPQGKTYNVYQKYVYSLKKDEIRVYKQSTSSDLLHTLSFEEGETSIYPSKALGHHSCPPDKYFATYTFSNKDLFSLEYKIEGPRKNYIIQTTFTRAPP